MGAGLALAAGLAPAAAQQELRIGFIAPMTGFFSQTGKDMVHGFQLYLDEHNGMLGGAKVKFIVEDGQGKPDEAVTKAKKLVLQDHVRHVHRRRAGLDRLCAGAGEHRAKDTSTFPRSRRPTI